MYVGFWFWQPNTEYQKPSRGTCASRCGLRRNLSQVLVTSCYLLTVDLPTSFQASQNPFSGRSLAPVKGNPAMAHGTNGLLVSSIFLHNDRSSLQLPVLCGCLTVPISITLLRMDVWIVWVDACNTPQVLYSVFLPSKTSPLAINRAPVASLCDCCCGCASLGGLHLRWYRSI